MDKKNEKEKKKGKDREMSDSCCYIADPCGCYMVDPCGCLNTNPCCYCC